MTSIAGKLVRTFVMQTDALARLKGRTGKQTIKVRYERHDHQHVHVGEGALAKGTQGRTPYVREDPFPAIEADPRAPLRR